MASEFSFTYQKGKPIITIPIQYQKNQMRRIPLLLDSGADYTILSRSDAILLGINYHNFPGKKGCKYVVNTL